MLADLLLRSRGVLRVMRASGNGEGAAQKLAERWHRAYSLYHQMPARIWSSILS